MNAVACPDADELAALLASEGAKGFADYSNHLETCFRCQQTLAELDDWPEATRYLTRVPDDGQGRPAATEPALDRIMGLLKSELPHGPASADPASEEDDDLPLSILRPADRPGLLGRLGEYEVIEVIGRGGMGVVFKAFDPTLQRLVAVKVMAGAGSGTARRRFKREAQAAAAVCHDHIVAVHGIHEAEGLPYLVMQFVPGESLQARLDRTGPLKVMEAVRIGLQTAAGLAAAHAQGLIHRDVKPANLLLENRRFGSAAEVAALLEGYLAHLRQPAGVLAPELPAPLAVAGSESVVKRLPQRLWLLTAAIPAILGLLFFQIDQPTPPSGGLRDQFVHDFRGRPLPENMTTFGPQADGFIKVEDKGLRINLPRGRDDVSSVGLSLPLAVGGDFEITTSFEILQAEAPPPGRPGYGTGVLMSVNQAARVGRLVRAMGKQVVSWDRWAMVDGKPKFLPGAAEGKGSAGRLRLTRTNSILSFLWSPDLAGDNFQKVHQCEFGTDEINLLRLETNSDLGGVAGSLDVRFLDLTVRSTLPEAGPAVDLEKDPSTRSKGWLLAAGLVGSAILLFLGVCIVLRSRRRPGEKPVPAPVRDKQKGNSTASASKQREPTDAGSFVSAPCSGCGQALRCKPELAGKKVKCPHCGCAVKVPE